jgi:hypothetical protein
MVSSYVIAMILVAWRGSWSWLWHSYDIAMTWIMVSSLASCGSGTMLTFRVGFTLGLAKSMGARSLIPKYPFNKRPYIGIQAWRLIGFLILYTRLGVSMSTGPDYVQLSPQSGPTLSTFCGPNLVTCKVMWPDLRSQYSGGVSVVKRINFSWTDGRDVHYPTVDPNSGHVESLGRE